MPFSVVVHDRPSDTSFAEQRAFHDLRGFRRFNSQVVAPLIFSLIKMKGNQKFELGRS